VPQSEPAELRQLLGALDDRQEVVAGELPDFAGETDAAIGEQDLGLADPAGVEEELTGRRVGGPVEPLRDGTSSLRRWLTVLVSYALLALADGIPRRV
jgi:hypothetical protein